MSGFMLGPQTILLNGACQGSLSCLGMAAVSVPSTACAQYSLQKERREQERQQWSQKFWWVESTNIPEIQTGRGEHVYTNTNA